MKTKQSKKNIKRVMAKRRYRCDVGNFGMRKQGRCRGLDRATRKGTLRTTKNKNKKKGTSTRGMHEKGWQRKVEINE